MEAAGAETYGGSANTAKGVRALRDALTDLGVSSSGYSPANGSGLGHQNRVAPATMADLLRKLYFDPRVGPDLLQSLSVGGVDGTTRTSKRCAEHIPFEQVLSASEKTCSNGICSVRLATCSPRPGKPS